MRFLCNLLLLELLSVLALLCEDEGLSRSSDRDPRSCSSCANLLCGTLGCWRGLLLVLPSAAVYI